MGANQTPFLVIFFYLLSYEILCFEPSFIPTIFSPIFQLLMSLTYCNSAFPTKPVFSKLLLSRWSKIRYLLCISRVRSRSPKLKSWSHKRPNSQTKLTESNSSKGRFFRHFQNNHLSDLFSHSKGPIIYNNYLVKKGRKRDMSKDPLSLPFWPYFQP